MASSCQDEKMDVSSASFYALHVALQTLKERCQNLQQRLTTVEEENEVLRKTAGLDMPSGDATNEDYLRSLVGDLVRQKTQLTDHIAMVTTENRQLWTRLSKLTKENSSLGMSITKIREAINSPQTTQATTTKGNNLIRSKTFTRPNPKERLVAADTTVGDEAEENMSLEEISLQIINKLVEGKENFEQKCGEILETTTSDNLCFGFKGATEAEEATDEVTATIDKCTTEAAVMREALLQQQGQLKQLLQSLRENKKPICNECIKRQLEVPAVKSVDSQTRDDYVISSTGQGQQFPVAAADNGQLMDRTCPMCGKCYKKTDDFEVFQRHVEWHFIDDNEMELSLDKNYELISHTAQNF